MKKFKLEDALSTIAVLMLVYLAYKAEHPDLASFGEGFAGILGGKAAHVWASSPDTSTLKPDKDGTV